MLNEMYEYEIRLTGEDLKIDHATWDNIRKHVRDNKWFFVVYENVKYKYVGDRTFSEKPARFDFEVATPMDSMVDMIYIDNN